MSKMTLMKTATTGLYKVVTVDGESIALPKARAERVAKALREGKTDLRRKAHAAPVAAKVVAA